MLMHRVHSLRTGVSCRILLLPFHFEMSQQYDTRIGKWLTRRFHLVLSGNPWRNIFSILDNINDMPFCRTIIFRYFPSVQDVTEIKSHTSTTADKEYLNKDSFISAYALLPDCFSAVHSTGRNATKKFLFFTTPCLCGPLKLSSAA